MGVARITLLTSAWVCAGADRVPLLVPPTLEEAGNLIVPRRLPREARREAAHIEVVRRLEKLTAWRRHELGHVGDRRLCGLMASRENPPQAIFEDRSPQRSGKRLEVIDPVCDTQATRLESIVDVVG